MAKQQLTETRLAALREKYRCGSFEYDGTVPLTLKTARSYFKTPKTYGVYIVRTKSNGKILRIGFSGTLGTDGNFKAQDMPKRLSNDQGKEKRAGSTYYQGLAKTHNVLIIEYIILNNMDGKREVDLPEDIAVELLYLYKKENAGNPPEENGKRISREGNR